MRVAAGQVKCGELACSAFTCFLAVQWSNPNEKLIQSILEQYPQKPVLRNTHLLWL